MLREVVALNGCTEAVVPGRWENISRDLQIWSQLRDHVVNPIPGEPFRSQCPKAAATGLAYDFFRFSETTPETAKGVACFRCNNMIA